MIGEGGIVKAPNGETVGAFLGGDGKYHVCNIFTSTSIFTTTSACT